MAYASNPIRNEAEEFIRLEIARLGPDGIDRGSIVRRFVERGASRTRIHEWIKAAVHEAKNPPPDTLEADLAVAEAAIQTAETAKVLNGLPTPKQSSELAAAVADLPRGSVSVLALPRISHDADSGRPSNLPPTPPASGQVLVDLQIAIDTIKRVMNHSHGADGKVRNARMALASAETLRRCLDTAMKLYETVNSAQAFEQFMTEALAEIATVSRPVAEAIVARLRALQARWAA